MAKPKKRNLLRWILFILLAAFLAIYLLEGSNWLKRIRYPLLYEDQICSYASKYEVDPCLTAAVIWVESRFMPEAVSPKDARGLMQIIPSTGEWIAGKIGLADFEEKQLYDPEVNIQIGCWYLGYLTSRFPDNRELVLAAYNAGIGNVDKWLRNREYSRDGNNLDYIPFSETRNYIEQVLKAYEVYKEIYPSLELQCSNSSSFGKDYD